MFQNDNKFNYIPLDSRGVLMLEVPKEVDTEGLEFEVHPFLPPLLNILMRERPTWRFKDTLYHRPNGKFRAGGFDVYDGGEKLGTLSVTTYGGVQYNFINARIKAKSKRGNAAYSADPQRAAQRILKAFHKRTPKERSTEACDSARSIIASVSQAKQWALQRSWQPIANDITRYVISHWDELAPRMGLPVDHSIVGDFTAHNHHDALLQASTNGAMLILREEEANTYLVSRPTGSTTVIRTMATADMPEPMLRKLGLLKLVEAKDIIPDVGMRIDANTFAITDGELHDICQVTP